MSSVPYSTLLRALRRQISADSYIRAASLQDESQLRLDLAAGNNNLSEMVLVNGVLQPNLLIAPGSLYAGATPETDKLPGATRMTEAAIEQFLTTDRETILMQMVNDAAGFSGTLTVSTDERYTLSFRSTEFATQAYGGDRERDVWTAAFGHGADADLAHRGLSYAQIVAMERWYAELKAPGGLLHEVPQVDVTGYSLGGHLAQVFTELHPTEVGETIIFNGAGRGAPKGGLSLQQLIAAYAALIDDPNAQPAGIIVPEPTDAFGISLKSRALAEGDPWSVASQNVYQTGRHQWAMHVLGPHSSGLLGASIGGEIAIDPLVNEKITYIYGLSTHNDDTMVSLSGVLPSRDRWVRVFIEDQPLIYGDIFGAGGAGDLEWDFMRTHSLSLLEDSLVVSDLFATLDPKLTQRKIDTILAAASNESSRSSLLGGAKAERDSLEQALNALQRAFPIGEFVKIPIDSQPDGFANLEDRSAVHRLVEDISSSLADVVVTIEPIAEMLWVGDSGLSAYVTRAERAYVTAKVPGASEILDIAREDTARGLAYRYALDQMTPFAVVGNPFADAVAYAADRFSTQYLEHRAFLLSNALQLNIDNQLTGKSPNPWSWKLVDMATEWDALLTRDSGGGQGADVPAVHLVFGTDGADQISGGSSDDFLYGRSGNDEIRGLALQDYIEGNDGNDTLWGGWGADTLYGGAGDDRLEGEDGADWLYGGDGNDRLVGGAGHDYLEGGVGEDRLEGGAGNDTYVIRLDGGSDTIADSVGHDVLILVDTDGTELYNGKLSGMKAGDNLWIAADGSLTFTRSSSLTLHWNDQLHVVLETFEDGDFGIRLNDGAATQDPVVSVRWDAPPEQWGPGTTPVRVLGDDNGQFFNGMEAGDVLLGFGGSDDLRGMGGDDRLEGGAGIDALSGGEGDDTLFAESARDIAAAIAAGDEGATGVKGDWLAGGMGDDTLVGSGAADALTGGQGNDLIVAGAGDDVISGDLNVVLARETNRADWSITPFPAPAFDAWWNGVVAEGESDDGDDVVHAGGGSDLVFGLGGDDALYGDTGADRMAGGAGDDRLFGGDGADELVGDGGVPAPGSTTVVAHSADHIDGGAGDDTLSGEGGDDVLYGGDGDDLMDGDANRLDFIASGFDYLHGEAGNDTMRGGMRDDYLSGGDGDDRADGEDGDDTLDGGAGNDVLEGGDGADDLSGGSGHDVLWGEAGADTLAGGSGDDTLRGWAGNDVLLGETGDDWLFGEEGDDAMDGGAGADRLSGSLGNDLIDGGDGDDIADGHEGNDELWGGAGDDTLNGGDGDDLLIGGAGADLLDGGIGSDTYVIDRYDRIVDGGGATTLVLTGGINAEDLRAREGMVDGRPSIVYEAAGHALMALQSGSNARPLSIELHSGVIAGHAIAVRPYGADIVATGDDSSDDMLGFSGDDWIEGRNGADLLAGAAGEDTLLGGLGDDSLNGGAGNDVLIGGPGSDSYRFSSGDGIDVIREADLHSDRIEFAGSIDRSSVRLTRTPTGDLVIHHGETDRVTVERFFEAPGYQIEQIRFADGSTIEYAELEAVPIGPVSGTTGDDHMTGSSAADTLIGGSGNDTYVLGWGIGADEVVEVAGETSAIVLQGGIRTDDLVIRRHDGDLVLSLGTEDGLRVRDGAAQAGDWWVHDGGGVRSLATLIADRDDENLTERFRREYRVAAMARVAEELRFQGYVPTADGLFERMDAVAHGRAYVDDVEWSIRDANGTLLGVVQEQRLENLPVTFTGHAFRMAEADRPVESRVDQVTGAPVERYVVRASAFAAEPLSAEALAPYAEFGPLTVVGVVNRTEYGVVYRLGEGDTPIQRDLRVETRSWSSGIRGTDGDDDLQYPSRGGAWIEAHGGDDRVEPNAESPSDGSQDEAPYYNLHPNESGVFIDAGAGNDFLNGTYQRDVLIGGAGDDIMRGDEQTDIYVIESGHGFDLIDDRGTLSHDWAGGVPGTLAQWLHGDMVAPLEREFGIDSDEAISSGAVSADRVLFGPGILPSTVQAKLVRGPDFYGVDRTLLELRWNDGDGLRVVGDYSTIRSTDSGNALFSGGELAEGEGIERYEFTDGTIWTARAARERALAQMNTVEIGPGSPEHVLTPGQAEAVRFKLTGEELLRPMDVPLISQDRNDLVFVLEGHTLLRLKDAVRPDGSATMPLLFWDNTVEITWSTGEGTFIWHEPEVIPEPIVRVDAPGHRGLLSGGAGDDTLQGSDGNDVVDGGPGDDVLTGDGGIVSTHTVTRAGPLGTLATVMRQLGPRIREYVQSGDFDRILSTTIAPGIPLTIGSALAILVPHLRNTTSNDLVHGGAGNDQLSATAGYDLLIGGAGDDALSVDTEGATVAYNRGDGRDCIESRPSAHLVLSLGGGLTVRDIELRRDGRDLDVDIAGGGEVSFTDWFDGLQVLRTTTLQVVESPAAGTQTATVRRYDFDAYAAAFQSDGAGRVDIERFRIESPAVPIPGDESAIAYGLGMGVGIGDVNRTLADLAVRPPAITTPQRILELIQTAGLNA